VDSGLSSRMPLAALDLWEAESSSIPWRLEGGGEVVPARQIGAGRRSLLALSWRRGRGGRDWARCLATLPANPRYRRHAPRPTRRRERGVRRGSWSQESLISSLPGPTVGGLSSGCLFCSAETKLIGSDAPHNQRPASQRLPRPRPDCQSTARHPQPQSPSNVFACTGISELQSSRSTPGRHQMEP
jgi:hypothetical protein